LRAKLLSSGLSFRRRWRAPFIERPELGKIHNLIANPIDLLRGALFLRKVVDSILATLQMPALRIGSFSRH
jgi:hypothetical protein